MAAVAENIILQKISWPEEKEGEIVQREGDIPVRNVLLFANPLFPSGLLKAGRVFRHHEKKMRQKPECPLICTHVRTQHSHKKHVPKEIKNKMIVMEKSRDEEAVFPTRYGAFPHPSLSQLGPFPPFSQRGKTLFHFDDVTAAKKASLLHDRASERAAILFGSKREEERPLPGQL